MYDSFHRIMDVIIQIKTQPRWYHKSFFIVFYQMHPTKWELRLLNMEKPMRNFVCKLKNGLDVCYFAVNVNSLSAKPSLYIIVDFVAYS